MRIREPRLTRKQYELVIELIELLSIDSTRGTDRPDVTARIVKDYSIDPNDPETYLQITYPDGRIVNLSNYDIINQFPELDPNS